jgi:hypothetical protein
MASRERERLSLICVEAGFQWAFGKESLKNDKYSTDSRESWKRQAERTSHYSQPDPCDMASDKILVDFPRSRDIRRNPLRSSFERVENNELENALDLQNRRVYRRKEILFNNEMNWNRNRIVISARLKRLLLFGCKKKPINHHRRSYKLSE